MISALFFALLLALQLSPPPAAAQPSMDAQCEAWLCLPGGFGPAECNPAKAAVDWRLSRVPPLDPLPPWSSCATHYAAIQANLRFDNHYRPPACDRSTGHGTVWVRVDGQRVGSQYDYTRQEPVRPCPPPPPPQLPVSDPTPDPTDPPDTTTEIPETDPCEVDPASCEVPPPDPCQVDPASCIPQTTCEDRGDCPPEEPCEDRGDCPEETCPDIPCPLGTVRHADCVCRPIKDFRFTPPVGPPVPCNTISCPHVQHGWGAHPLAIHWTLRAAPPATPQ